MIPRRESDYAIFRGMLRSLSIIVKVSSILSSCMQFQSQTESILDVFKLLILTKRNNQAEIQGLTELGPKI